MNWIALFFAIELGWLPTGEFAMYDVPALVEKHPIAYTLYTDIDGGAELFGHLFIGGGVRTSVWRLTDTGLTFWPFNAVYRFYAGARWGPLEVGWRHYCMHPVVPYFGLLGELIEPVWEGALNEWYVRVQYGP